jgi:hypothetical protein
MVLSLSLSIADVSVVHSFSGNTLPSTPISNNRVSSGVSPRLAEAACIRSSGADFASFCGQFQFFSRIGETPTTGQSLNSACRAASHQALMLFNNDLMTAHSVHPWEQMSTAKNTALRLHATSNTTFELTGHLSDSRYHGGDPLPTCAPSD